MVAGSVVDPRRDAEEMYLIRPDGSGLTPLSVEGVPHPLFPDWVAP